MKVYIKYFLIATAFCAFNYIQTIDGRAPPNYCACSIFKAPTPANRTDVPLISQQIPIPIPCNDVGRKSCREVCSLLAKTEKPNAGTKLCPLLGTTEKPFKSYVYSRICHEAWIYTGLVPTLELCCRNKLQIPC